MNEKEWKWVEMNERWISKKDWMSEYELRWGGRKKKKKKKVKVKVKVNDDE